MKKSTKSIFTFAIDTVYISVFTKQKVTAQVQKTTAQKHKVY